VNSLPKTVTRQRRGCDLNPGPSAPESSTLTTRLPSHPPEGRRGKTLTEAELQRLCGLPVKLLMSLAASCGEAAEASRPATQTIVE